MKKFYTYFILHEINIFIYMSRLYTSLSAGKLHSTRDSHRSDPTDH